MTALRLISFYTPDWDYPKYADLLTKDCVRLNIDHRIVEKASAKSYVDNCNIKPFFIRECINQHRGPVLWVDVDTTINKLPEELNSDMISQYDVAGYQNQRFSDRIYVNSIWFNYTENSLRLIDKWCDLVSGSIDDSAFNQSLNVLGPELKMLLLPSHQHRTLDWYYHSIPEDSYLVHRLSSSVLKWEYKNKV